MARVSGKAGHDGFAHQMVYCSPKIDTKYLLQDDAQITGMFPIQLFKIFYFHYDRIQSENVKDCSEKFKCFGQFLTRLGPNKV